MGTLTYHLYIDDSGSRQPDHEGKRRNDGMDHFAMGGVLIPAENVGEVSSGLAALKERHSVTAPLHSTKMRSKKGDWSWLGLPSEQPHVEAFMSDLNRFLETMHGHVTGCIVDRPGYVRRYSNYSVDQRWRLCKSAYAIVVERAAKIAVRDGRKLAVYVEQTGPKEDKQITSYHLELKNNGMIFNPETSSKYDPISQANFCTVLLREPKFFTKSLLMGQIADIVLYPLVKGRYDSDYRVYQMLKNAKKLIDDGLADGNPNLGVKYYCFDH